MSRCRHTDTTYGPDKPFTDSVATKGRTDANRAAHGGTSYTETCMQCGKMRDINQNGRHLEYSAWRKDGAL